MFFESYQEVEDSEKNWHLHTPWLEPVSAVAWWLRPWKPDAAGSSYSLCRCWLFSLFTSLSENT